MRIQRILFIFLACIAMVSCSKNSDEDSYEEPQSEVPADPGEEESEADPEEEEETGEEPTALLGELILTNPDLSLFAEAIQFLPQSLLEQLNNPNANLTLFAPTDQAIMELLDNNFL